MLQSDASLLYAFCNCRMAECGRVLNALSHKANDVAERMYSDKKLLDDFSNFYQSYLLVQSGVVDASKMKDVVTNFPKEIAGLKKK